MDKELQELGSNKFNIIINIIICIINITLGSGIAARPKAIVSNFANRLNALGS